MVRGSVRVQRLDELPLTGIHHHDVPLPLVRCPRTTVVFTTRSVLWVLHSFEIYEVEATGCVLVIRRG